MTDFKETKELRGKLDKLAAGIKAADGDETKIRELIKLAAAAGWFAAGDGDEGDIEDVDLNDPNYVPSSAAAAAMDSALHRYRSAQNARPDPAEMDAFRKRMGLTYRRPRHV